MWQRAAATQPAYAGELYYSCPAAGPIPAFPPADALPTPWCCRCCCCADALPIPHRLRKRRAVNWWGLFVFLFFIAAFGFYVWARAAHTLGLGPMLW